AGTGGNQRLTPLAILVHRDGRLLGAGPLRRKLPRPRTTREKANRIAWFERFHVETVERLPGSFRGGAVVRVVASRRIDEMGGCIFDGTSVDCCSAISPRSCVAA